MSAAFLFVGAFFAFTGLWAINHPEAVGSSNIWTAWVSPGTRRFLAVFQVLGGLAMVAIGVVLG